LERLYEIARKEKADIVHGRMDQFSGGRRWGCPWAAPFKVASGRSFVESLLRLGRAWNLAGKLYHRPVVEKALTELPVNKRLFCADDLLFSFFFGLQAGRYAGCPEIVYHYRLNHDNFFNQPEKWPPHTADHFYVLAYIKARLEKTDLPAGADLALARGLIIDCLGKPYLTALYGRDFRRSPLSSNYKTARKAAGLIGFFHKATFPGRLVVFGLIQLWENGVYEFVICFRQALALTRRSGFGHTLKKMQGRLIFCA
jgi:hypothetical protein